MAFSGAFVKPFRPAFDAGGAAAGNGLLNGLVAYWSLDEVSGNRLDSSGNGLTMTPTGGGYRAGRIGNAFDVLADGNYLSINNDALRVSASSATWSLWVWIDNFKAVGSYLFCRWTPAADWGIYVSPDGAASTFLAYNVASSYSEAITPSSAIPTGAWTHIMGWFDYAVGANGTIYTQVNNGTIYSAALAGAHYSGSNTLTAIGQLGANSYGDMDGAIDEVGMWSTVLTAGQRMALYAGGAGLAYSAFTT